MQTSEAVDSRPKIKALLASDLVDSTRLVEALGDSASAALFAEHDRLARRLLAEYRGQEIDKSDGFLLLFERPIEATEYAFAYHAALLELSRHNAIELRARVGIHLGELILRRNPTADVELGAKPVDVEGLAKPTVFRVASLARPGQTLLTRAAFGVARRAGESGGGRSALEWIAHGGYRLKGVEEPIEVFEVAVAEGSLGPPVETDKVRRVTEDGAILGWRPGPGLCVPERAHWRLREKLGAGGFGEVWLAVHDKTDEPRVFKFCFEAVALRALKHETALFRLLKESLGQRPDIARILDWNFEAPPYFIEAEYTDGGNFLDWAEQRGGLDRIQLETRLELVVQVAEALGAAHSVGVLHKDIKPSNVLIAGGSDPPRVRLTDFGIGRVTDRELLDEAGITALEPADLEGLTELSSTTGTRLYMAPERLEGRPATVQADIYALGVLLYQMVVGDFQRALGQGWERDIDDELLREDIAEAVDGSPRRRFGNALRLAERLRSIEERRREAAERVERAADAERARVALARSRRRRRVLATALGAISVFAVVVAYQARRASQAADRANREALRASEEAERANREAETTKRVSDFLVGLFSASDPSESRGASVTAREMLDRGADRIGEELADEPIVRARLQQTIGAVYYTLGLYKEAEPILERALTTASAEFGRDSLPVAETATTLANVYWYQDRFDDAEKLYLLSLANHEKHLDPDDPAIAKSLNNLGLHYVVLGQLDRAEPLYERSLAIREKAYGAEHPRVSTALHNLAHLYTQRDKNAEALALFERVLAIDRATVGERHPSFVHSQMSVSGLHRKMGDLDSALAKILRTRALADEVLGENHPITALVMAEQASCLRDADRLEEADGLFVAALTLQEEHHGARHAYVAETLEEYARLLARTDRRADAVRAARRALAIRREVTGEASAQTRAAEELVDRLTASTSASRSSPGT